MAWEKELIRMGNSWGRGKIHRETGGEVSAGWREALSKGPSAPVRSMQQGTHSPARVTHAGGTANGGDLGHGFHVGQLGVSSSIDPGLAQSQDQPGKTFGT